MFKEINTRFPALPFTFRELETDKASKNRLGIGECLNHGLLHPYPVLLEKNGELVAQFKATVLLMPNGSDRQASSRHQTHDSLHRDCRPSTIPLYSCLYSHGRCLACTAMDAANC